MKQGAWDPDPLDPQHIGFLDPDPGRDPEKYEDPRIRIQGAKYQPKTGAKIFYAQNPNLLKKERLSKISFPECFINNGKKERNII